MFSVMSEGEVTVTVAAPTRELPIAGADENYISSLYALNVAEASLARAMGAAEKTIKSFFGGK